MDLDWENYLATKRTFGSGMGVNSICQSCGNRQTVRLQRGCKISLTQCGRCGKLTLKRAKIDDKGVVLNDPLVSVCSEVKRGEPEK